MVVYPKKISAYFPSSLAAIIIAVIANFILNPDAAASNVTEVGSIPQKLVTDQSLLLNGIVLQHITDLLMPALSNCGIGND